MPGVPYLLYRKEFMKMSDNNNNAKTMYEAVPAAAELNKVPGFDPLKFLRRAGDSMKLPAGAGAAEAPTRQKA